ncbi:MAG: hypothetical protein FJY10_07660 [Bacteroidetes bacterium]|nr:hypothetical protein [Bacteroidota bacterium]
MTSWLEEAERIERRKQKTFLDTERGQIKRDRIFENYQQIRDKYKLFIDTMHGLCDRVNRLSLEFRKKFGKIDLSYKETNLGNQLYVFSSSSREEKREGGSLWNVFTSKSSKHIRVMLISISKFLDHVEIEVKDQHLLKQRIRTTGNVDEKQRYDGLQKVEDPNKVKDGDIRGLFLIHIDKLDEAFGMRMIDWLVFNEDIGHLKLTEMQGDHIPEITD